MSQVDTIADRQAEWSQTANHLKSQLDRTRWLVFLLSVLGALTAAVASQMVVAAQASIASTPRTWIVMIGVACLATATFLTSRLLGADHVTAWVRARAISEALKSAAYKFAARAAPYNDADEEKAAALLDDERRKIEHAGDDLLPKMVKATDKGVLPRQRLSPGEYIANRVEGQVKEFYRPRADAYRTSANRLRRVEFILALAATLITALASVTGKTALISGVTFDVAALTAVLTTIATSVLAHIEASRFDYLATSYLAAARRLEDLLSGERGDWSDFVNACENVIATENASWMAKWTRSTA
jgi:SMODS and SLOG-associating 2TM effector domain 1/Protein of unknown function (DUF4231)